MIKISEAIKYYESFKIEDHFGSYFSDPTITEKIGTLKRILEAIGDVDMKDDYLKAFMYELRVIPVGISYEKFIEEIKVLYELCKDTEMTTKDLCLLISCYRSGPYKLMFKEIKELIRTGKLSSGLFQLRKEAYDIAREEAYKLEYLKEEYGSSFIEDIQQVILEECLSADKVLEIIPSKELIDSSKVAVPGLQYHILSGEDLVTRRLRYLDVEREYQETAPDEAIKLGYCSHGDTIFTSFTKREYEDDLKSGKRLIKKK